MDKNLDFLINKYDESEEYIMTAPYYMVTYIDDCLRTHITTVKEEWHLRFLKDRYYIKECKHIGKENFDNIEK